MVRIWEHIPVECLCKNHLLGEHKELHAIWTALVLGRGCVKHPEALRWQDHLPALVLRHDRQVQEMKKRGFKHKSPLLDMPGDMIMPKCSLSFKEQLETLLYRSRFRSSCSCQLDSVVNLFGQIKAFDHVYGLES